MSTFSIMSLIKFFKKVIIHVTSNLMSSYLKFSRKNASITSLVQELKDVPFS